MGEVLVFKGQLVRVRAQGGGKYRVTLACELTEELAAALAPVQGLPLEVAVSIPGAEGDPPADVDEEED